MQSKRQTVYTVKDDRRIVDKTTDAEQAERLSRAGLEVTAEVI